MGMELYRKGCKPHPFQENISLCALSVTHLRERLKEEIFEVDRTSQQLTCKLYSSESWRKKFHVKTCFAVIWNCLQSLAPFCSLLAQSRITIYHLVLSQESKNSFFSSSYSRPFFFSHSLLSTASIDWCLLELKIILMMSKCSRPLLNTTLPAHIHACICTYNESD